MQGKIGFEEHFAITQTLADANVFLPDRCWGVLSRRLIDVRQERIAAMDAHGMEMMILSLNAPTVQGIPEPERAETVARAANDALAEEVAATRSLRRVRGLADAGRRDGGARAGALRQGAQVLRRPGQRLLAGR